MSASLGQVSYIRYNSDGYESKRHHVDEFLASLKRKELKENVSHYADLREQALEWLGEKASS